MRSKQYIKILTVSEYKQVLREADIARCSLNIVGVKFENVLRESILKKVKLKN